MHIEILTLFPDMFPSPFECSIIRRARERGYVHIGIRDIRRYAEGPHRVSDDYPYGGGGGMIMKPEPIVRAVEAAKQEISGGWVILLTPQGDILNQERAWEMSRRASLILICGRYEGVDERVRMVVDQEISIGDYILTGGELAAMVVVDAVVRLIPGVLGKDTSKTGESFYRGLLEHPQYTRPRIFRDAPVPEVILSGDHARIAQWRRRASLERTLRRRPDLLKSAQLNDEDRRILRELGTEYSQ
ncbi:MAG: tRNA (guanosine(37)-N1)-methyltransferase TrmD [Deltaproteobacteria bacterium]|nr:tRNA (guanosine(37)-N1)-methyltransferase TrmD [Deltaproteobacteria bacterium]MBW2308407.1 tRNA (guanosine(37)-N1)-methyltransferase TrmD [Deltaproteobacteria bacterium]